MATRSSATTVGKGYNIDFIAEYVLSLVGERGKPRKYTLPADGTTTVFLLDPIPVSDDQLLLFWNGQLQTITYTFDASTGVLETTGFTAGEGELVAVY